MSNATPKPETIDRIQSQVRESFALLAGMQLDLFTPLKDGPLPAEEIAAATGTAADKLERLLYALVVAGLLTFKDGLFSNTPESDHFLVRGRPAFIGDSHAFTLDIWQALLRTADTVRTGIPQARHDYRQMSKAEQLDVFRGLHSGAKAAGYDLAQRFDFSAYQSLLDVGGGSGGLAIALTKVHPQLHATVVELPEVTAVTEHFLKEEEATDRVKVLVADVVDGALEGQFDVAVARAFTQILAPIQVECVLQNIYNVLMPGGAIYLLCRVLDNSRLSPVDTVFFDLVFLNIYDHGRAYTEQEYRNWLTEAGYIDFERIVLPKGHILVARKPF